MPSVLSSVLLILLAPLAARAAIAVPPAALSDVQTFLGETAFDEVEIAPNGSRLAFITRRNDFARDREAFAVWVLDLSPRPAGKGMARPVRIAAPASCSALHWSPDGRSLVLLAAAAPAAPVQLFRLEPAAGSPPH